MKKTKNIFLLVLFTISVVVFFSFGFSEYAEDWRVRHYITLPMSLLAGIFYLFCMHSELMELREKELTINQPQMMPFMIGGIWIYTIIDLIFIRSDMLAWIMNMSLGISVFFSYISYSYNKYRKYKKNR